MSENNAKKLKEQAAKRFGERSALMIFWQECAEQFYPERAGFTGDVIIGDDFASHLFDSTPIQNRYELGLAIQQMVRPRGQVWPKMRPEDDNLYNESTRPWLAIQSERLYKKLYSAPLKYQTVSGLGAQDMVTFGNSVNSMFVNSKHDNFIFRNHHLRDCAWSENAEGDVDTIFVKLRIELRIFVLWFGEKHLPESRKKEYKTDPYAKIEVIHCLFPAATYEFMKKGKKNWAFASCYISNECKEILKEGGYDEFRYIVDRWMKWDNNPYALSPSASYSLPDSRVAQIQARVFLDAGERAADPPLIVRDGALIDQAVNNFAGGTSFVDSKYNEHQLGPAIRPIQTGSNLPYGMEMRQDTREVLAAAWHLNKITMPSQGEMTAAETYERIDERLRTVAPLTEPFENGNVAVLDLLLSSWRAVGGAWRDDEIPQELIGADITYEFDTPVTQAKTQRDAQKAVMTMQAIGAASEIHPEAKDLYHMDDIVKAAADGDKWEKSADEVAKDRAERQKQVMEQQGMEQLQQAGEIAEKAPAMEQAAGIVGEMMQPANDDATQAA